MQWTSGLTREYRATLLVAASALVLISACVTAPGTAPALPPVASRPSPSSAPLARTPAPPPSAGSRSTPIPDRPIHLAGDCSQTEEDGFREQGQLRVENNEVKTLSWQLWVGKRGSCRFELTDFTQTRQRPHIELQARDGSRCKLLVWQDPRRVTLAHDGCQRFCSGNIYDEAWPIMFDPRNGRCGRLLS